VAGRGGLKFSEEKDLKTRKNWPPDLLQLSENFSAETDG
jgi:hypothetical protein